MSRAEEKAVQRLVEVRSFKWPHRPNGMALTHFIGEDLW